MVLREQYAPGACTYASGFNEIRWDTVGCNLQCQFCWSPASRPEKMEKHTVRMTPEEIAVETVAKLEQLGPASTFIRFTGGEPTLQWPELSSIIRKFHSDARIRSCPLLVQTNGIEIGGGHVDIESAIEGSHQRYLFELSIKGVNKEEFEILTGKSGTLYDLQLAGFDILSALSRRLPNLVVVAVLGVYHSSMTGASKYAFFNEGRDQILFDDRESWDPGFKQIWQNARLKWAEPLRMSPVGVWRNLLQRCGPEGSNILRHFPQGIPTNQNRLFPAKPRSVDYARMIIERSFWRN